MSIRLLTLALVAFSGLAVAQVQPYPPTGGLTPIAAGLLGNPTGTAVPGLITLGTNLSFTGTTLNAAGTGTAANPTATIGAAAVNGVATSYMRSDAAPKLPTTMPSGITYPSPVQTGIVTGSSTANVTSTFNNTATDQNIGLAQNISVTDPTAGWNSAVVGVFGFPTYTGTATPNAASHLVGVAGLAGMNSTGVTFPLLEGVEGRSDVAAGNVTSIILGDFFDGAIVTGSTVSNLYGEYSHFNNAGTTTTAYGSYADVETNTGTIGTYTGYYQANVSGKGLAGTLTTGWSFYNADPKMPASSAAPIIDNAVSFDAPSTGTTFNIGQFISTEIFFAGTNLATLTVTFPPTPRDGQPVTLATVGGIVALTLSGGTATVGAPVTSIPANGWITYKYDTAGNSWYQIGGSSFGVAIAAVSVGTSGFLIASLPTCNAAEQGQTAYVTNGQTTPTYLGAVSTTGAIKAPVFCNGSGWVYH